MARPAAGCGQKGPFDHRISVLLLHKDDEEEGFADPGCTTEMLLYLLQECHEEAPAEANLRVLRVLMSAGIPQAVASQLT